LSQKFCKISNSWVFDIIVALERDESHFKPRLFVNRFFECFKCCPPTQQWGQNEWSCENAFSQLQGKKLKNNIKHTQSDKHHFEENKLFRDSI